MGLLTPPVCDICHKKVVLFFEGFPKPDHISGSLMLHGGVDEGDQGYVGHIADVCIDQELEVGDVDQRQITAKIHSLSLYLQ